MHVTMSLHYKSPQELRAIRITLLVQVACDTKIKIVFFKSVKHFQGFLLSYESNQA